MTEPSDQQLVTLAVSAETAAYVRARIHEGTYESPDAVIRDLIELANEPATQSDEPQSDVEQRLDRLTKAVVTMAHWLVEAQTGFGERDAEAITEIVKGERG